MNDDVKTGFDMPKPDTGIGTVSIGGDAKPMPEKKKDPINYAPSRCWLFTIDLLT